MTHPLENMTELALARITRNVCVAIKERLPPDTRFCVLYFQFNELGITQYGSNCEREDMIKALREAADRLEKRQDTPRRGPPSRPD